MSEMQFRSPTDTPIHVAVTLGGHAAVVGPEFRTLPRVLHREAIARGCITNVMEAAGAADVPEHKGQVAGFDRHALIKEQIKVMLGRDEPDDFTNNGLPDLRRLKGLCGFNLDAKEMQAAWNELNDEAGASESDETE